jgi:hypothetical protein
VKDINFSKSASSPSASLNGAKLLLFHFWFSYTTGNATFALLSSWAKDDATAWVELQRV